MQSRRTNCPGLTRRKTSGKGAMVNRLRNAPSFAWLVAAVCVLGLTAGDLFRGIHLLSARHVVCVEHGELVHLGDLAREETPSPASGHPEALPGGPNAHHHDHCELAAARPSTPCTVVLSSALVTHMPFAGEVLSLPALPPGHRASVLTYAPKQSPPERAS